MAINVMEQTNFIDFLKLVRFCVSFAVPNINVNRNPFYKIKNYIYRGWVYTKLEIMLITKENKEVY